MQATRNAALSIIRLIASFFKIGVIGFGGGSALIPIVHKEIVAGARSMSESEYLKHTVIANVTPGALPVKLGSTCGLQLSNAAGSALCAYAVSIPGVFATVFIIALFSMLGQAAIDYLNFASIGITIFIVFLLMHYVWETVMSGDRRVNAAIFLVSLCLTAGREAREIVEMALGMPKKAFGASLFNLSMIHVMIISFFLIFHILLAGGSRGKIAVGIVLAAVYAVLSGDLLAGTWRWTGAARLVVGGLFLLDLGWLILTGRRSMENKAGSLGLNRSAFRAIILFLALPLAPVAFGVVSGHFPDIGLWLVFLGDVAISTITSFGGGEAYVAVADSIFVQAGYCDPEVFYGRIVPVANALPGPILVKIAAALGFVWGQSEASILGGALVAASSMMLAIGACCALALLVLNYYEALRDSPFILSLRQYILPVICGTLASTSLAMLYESMKVTGGYGFSAPWTLAAMLAGVALTFWLNAKRHPHDLIMLIGWVVAGMAFMMAALGRP